MESEPWAIVHGINRRVWKTATGPWNIVHGIDYDQWKVDHGLRTVHDIDC